MEKNELVKYEKRSFLQRLMDRFNHVNPAGLTELFEKMKQTGIEGLIPETYFEEGATPARMASDYLDYLSNEEYRISKENGDKGKEIGLEHEWISDYDVGYTVTNVTIEENGQITKATSFAQDEILSIIAIAGINHGKETFDSLLETAANKLSSLRNLDNDPDLGVQHVANGALAMKLMKGDETFKKALKEYKQLMKEKGRYDKNQRAVDRLNEEKAREQKSGKDEFRERYDLPDEEYTLNPEERKAVEENVRQDEEIQKDEDSQGIE